MEEMGPGEVRRVLPPQPPVSQASPHTSQESVKIKPKRWFDFLVPEEVEDSPEVRAWYDQVAKQVEVEVIGGVAWDGFSEHPTGGLTYEKICELREELQKSDFYKGETVETPDDWAMIANVEQLFDMVAPGWARVLAKLRIIDKEEYVEHGGMIVAHYFRLILAVSLAIPVVGFVVIVLVALLQK